MADFLAESAQYLTELNNGILMLEKNPDTPELLTQLFRTAHSLKGASRMMGFAEVAAAAHAIEELFSELQAGKVTFDTAAADKVFAMLDTVKNALGQAAESAPPPKKGKTVKKPDIPVETTPEPMVEASPAPAAATESVNYLRVPVDRINHLMNLIGEIVIGKVKSSYKINTSRRLLKQIITIENEVRNLKESLKASFSITDQLLHHQGSILRASQRMDDAAGLLNIIHTIEAILGHLRQEMGAFVDDIHAEVFHLNPVIEELQQKVKEMRMLPCAVVFEGFPRLVRDLAREQGKNINFVVDGAETELDKKVLESIKAPLIHVLRNAVDHGIELPKDRKAAGKEEMGTITLRATQQGGKVIIAISDDGQGIDLEHIKAMALEKELISAKDLEALSDDKVLNLIFKEGFSTAPIITDVSGRGIGLNVVQEELSRLKGDVHLTTQKGKGSTILLELPLTIAIQRVLLVGAGGCRWAFPVSGLVETVRFALDDVKTIENRMVARLHGASLPLVSLVDTLNIAQKPNAELSTRGSVTAVVVSSIHYQVGFIVDRVEGEEEVFVKSVGPYLGKVKCVGGATILASGEVIVILDTDNLIQAAQQTTLSSLQPHKQRAAKKLRKKVLVVEDSLTTRELEKTILENSGYDVETAIDGLDALDKLGHTVYDVIVSDIQMPRMDGFELCKTIKSDEKLKAIPVIFVTALSKEEEKRKGIKVGAQAYITKGQFDQGNLLETIERVT
jgi:chemotaxis protein histidine kinase CheA